MNTHETEIKLALPGESAWRWVLDQIAPVRVVHQTNHFFDRRDRALRAARIGLRLRETAGGVRLTAKGQAEGEARDGPAAVVTRRVELESDSDPETLDRALRDGLVLDADLDRWRRETSAPSDARDLVDRLEDVARGGPLLPIGSFTNERSIGSLRLRDDLGELEIDVELDRTTFPYDRIDYELEVERSSESGPALARTRAALEDWLANEGGIHAFARESKLARFEAILEAGEARSR